MNRLYFGDNLEVLRGLIPDESVDLVYLDPPFNSKRNYNIFLKSPEGLDSHAQLTAFDDTWRWGAQAEVEYDDVLGGKNTDVASLLKALREFMSESDTMAYLTFMANRLVELHRVLKPTGSVYLHCDPTASHYLKLLMDAVFGSKNFQNEIVWSYRGGGISASRWGRRHDILLFYSKGDTWTFNADPVREEYSPESLERLKYKARSFRANKTYENYEANPLGKHPDDVWPMQPIMPSAKERLGYPTQKPIALLERVILASSNEGDVVLDPFCGCGTALHAAQLHGRAWIGIDVTHLAVALVERRLKAAFPKVRFEVHGTPTTLDGAAELAERDKYEFQNWACSLVDVWPYKAGKKGADQGIDGVRWFKDIDKATRDRVDRKIIVSVKGGKNVGVPMVRDLVGTMKRVEASIGLFITLAQPTQPMKAEAAAAGLYEAANGQKYPRVQILTVAGLLDGSERPQYFDVALVDSTFKQAEREVEKTQFTMFDAPVAEKANKK